MIKKIQILFLILSFTCGYGQVTQARWDSLIVIREEQFDKHAKEMPFYVESPYDTLLYYGERYFFRRTPLANKKGYTNIIPEMHTFTILGFVPPAGKGYHLLWYARNDSLFIADIQPVDRGLSFIKLDSIAPRNTNRSNLETFTGGNFKDGLLFVDWIDGDFPIVKANPNPPETREFPPWWLIETDYLYPPL